jgi:predicted transcriptional regulator
MKNSLLVSAAFLSFFHTNSVSAEEAKDWLFVLTGLSAQVSDNVLSVVDEDGKVFGFTDRPFRSHANLTTEQFESLWGTDASFSQDPPNAVLTYMIGEEAKEVEIILESAVAAGDSMSFDFKIVSGEVLKEFGRFSLFVDGTFIPFDSSF